MITNQSKMVRRGLLGVAMAGALVGGTAGAAFAASDGQSTDAHVAVGSVITMSGLTSGFTLSGLPGDNDSDSSVTYNVETNNTAGYTVTVQSRSDELLPAATVANSDSIPIGSLEVRNSAGNFVGVSDASSTLLHTQAARSIEGGDALGSDYQMTIPFKNVDTYTATLDYVATSL